MEKFVESTVNELKRKIKSHSDELQKLQAQLEETVNEPLEYSVAKFLHGSMCHHNHIDDCGWYYEIVNDNHNWDCSQHKVYLNTSRKLLKYCESKEIDINDVIHAFEIIKGHH